MINNIIKSSIKVIIRQFQREKNDKKTGLKFKFAKHENTSLQKSFAKLISVDQTIHYNPLSANKIENIKIAIKNRTDYHSSKPGFFILGIGQKTIKERQIQLWPQHYWQ